MSHVQERFELDDDDPGIGEIVGLDDGRRRLGVLVGAGFLMALGSFADTCDALVSQAGRVPVVGPVLRWLALIVVDSPARLLAWVFGLADGVLGLILDGTLLACGLAVAASSIASLRLRSVRPVCVLVLGTAMGVIAVPGMAWLCVGGYWVAHGVGWLAAQPQQAVSWVRSAAGTAVAPAGHGGWPLTFALICWMVALLVVVMLHTGVAAVAEGSRVVLLGVWLFSGILAGGLGEAERRLTTDFRTLDGWGFTVTFLIVFLAASVVLSCANAVANMSREPRWGNAVLYSRYILEALLIGLLVTRIPVVDGAAYQALMWLGKVPVAIMQVIFGVLELASWLMLGFLVAGVVLWQWGRATVLPVLDARDGGSGDRGCCDLGVAAGFLVSQFLCAALVFSMVPHVDPDSALGRLHEAWTTSLLPWPTGVVLTLLEACLPPGSAGALREVFGVYDPTIDCVIMTVVAMVAVATLALGSGTWRRVRRTVLLAARASASLGVACIFALVLAWIEDASS